MKAFTDIEQSKKLAEILPIESADIWYAEVYEGKIVGYDYIISDTPYYSLSFTKPSENNYSQNTVKDIPCWSLTALLGVIPSASLDSSDDHYFRIHCKDKFSEWHNNPIDACVEIIFRINKQML